MKVSFPYTAFSLPDHVNLTESEIRRIRSGQSDAKVLIIKAHAEFLKEGFREKFPECYNMAKGTKWGAGVFFALAALFFFTNPFPDAEKAGIISLSLGAFFFMIRFVGLGWALTYKSYKSVVKAHLKLLGDAIDREMRTINRRQ